MLQMHRLTRVRRSFTWFIPIAVVTVAGCSRQAFRERTDKDVEAIISQKNVVPQWQVQNWHVYPDPRARFADPSNPDFPPYPPDDYAAKVLSPNPQRPGRGGVGRHEGDGYLKQIIEWDAQNRAEDAANEPPQLTSRPDNRLGSDTGQRAAVSVSSASVRALNEDGRTACGSIRRSNWPCTTAASSRTAAKTCTWPPCR